MRSPGAMADTAQPPLLRVNLTGSSCLRRLSSVQEELRLCYYYYYLLIGDSNTWNIPRPKEGEMRDGRPRVNWAIETAKVAWIKHEMYRGVGRGKNKGTYKEFDYTLKTHIEKIKDEAKKGNY